MAKFPADAPLRRVVKTFSSLGFRIVRQGTHIAMERRNDDGSSTPLTLPNHGSIKASTLRTILTQAGISRDEFLVAYHKM